MSADKQTGGPAFPSGLIDPSTPEDAIQAINKGMTLRQYAAVKLKVPNSGVDWLDAMIIKSLRDQFASEVMSGICQYSHVVEGTWLMESRVAYAVADAMLKERKL